MAQQLKGEVTAKYDGQSYKLVLNFNALCDFEDVTGRNGLTLVDQIEAGEPINARDMRYLIWAALRQHHLDATVGLAGLIITHDQKAIRKLTGAEPGKSREAEELEPAQAPGEAVEPPNPDPPKPKRKTRQQ
ncbi:GTA-gp10 family protein [Ketogulonicigenium vulgare]|uniref:GTA-gp10 family protein n=1 Tax=Ketogulonicigenium vulgare TaxID=92945 RepID=UPI0005C445E4|nr:GTA-gp10 family protein [Ketogulonicigenium vulgare]ALJ80754.1 hypothetical protein KVH_05900 [Ketogulonicigenium vulgare]ANW33549.1 hypothetical protein KvSKV_05870 [Ketogulonicigenium vulgare]